MFRKIVTAVAVLLVLLLIAAVALIYTYQDMLEPVNPEASEDFRIIDIPSGSNAEAIASVLFGEGLIKNEFVFRLFVRQHNLGQGLIAGRYRLSPSMSLSQVVEIILSGDIYTETTWFTIPEGLTVLEMAAILEEKGLVNREKFLEMTRYPSVSLFEQFPILKEIDQNAIEYLLEGYLFPDTYEIYSDDSEEDIIGVMLRRLDQVISAVNGERIAETDFSWHEILTIASLIEREVRVDHERKLVAGVIYNRLAIGQRLEIDATIQYALGENKEFLLYSDLEIESPYNTYRNDGLPPGPIAAPGEASIIAALFPEAVDYYFYNYKYDGTGEHYFSKTYREHLENVHRAEANLD